MSFFYDDDDDENVDDDDDIKILKDKWVTEYSTKKSADL